MLHRGNSDAAKRIRRAKSITSVKSSATQRKSASFDPGPEDENAVRAAICAYEKGYGTMQDKSAKTGAPRDIRLGRQGSHLARHNSGASNRGRVDRHQLSKSQQSERLESSNTVESSSRSTPLPVTKNIGSTTAHHDFASGMLPPARPGARADTSQAKTRKANSSFGPNSAMSRSGEEDSARHVVDDLTTKSGFDVNNRAPFRCTREQQSDDNIVAMARDMYLQNHIQSQEIKPIPKARRSSVFIPFASRMRRSNRESMQSDSTVSHESLVLEVRRPASGAVSMQITETKSRRISMSLKRGLRRAFGRSSDSSSIEIPSQQVEASRPHYGDPAFRRQGSDSPFALNPDPAEYYEDHEILRLRPRFHEDINSIKPKSSEQSLRKFDTSNHQVRSRVTSWNDSTKENTMILHEVGQLPIITESPEKRQVSQVPSIHNDQDMARNEIGNTLRTSSSRFTLNGAVDSRRLLSALKKHVGNVKAKQQLGGIRTVSASTNNSWRPGDSPELSRESVHLSPLENGLLTSTIRDVPREFFKPYSGLLSSETEHAPLPSVRERSVSTFSAQFVPNSQNVHKNFNGNGSAVVTGSRPVSKWTLGGSTTDSIRHVPNTSNEWRTWAVNEAAELDAGPRHPLRSYSSQRNLPEPLRSAESDPCEDSTQDVDSVAIPEEGTIRRRRNIFDNQPRQGNKRLDHMNDRFPMLPTSRKPSKGSLAPSLRTASSQIQPKPEDRSETQATSTLSTEQSPKPESSIASLRKSNIPLRTRNNMNSIMNRPRIRPTRNDPSHRSSPIPNNSENQTPSPQRYLQEAESNLPLRPRALDPSHNIPRKPAQAPLDENFLLRISRGPYAPPSSSPSKVSAKSSVESLDLLAGRRPYAVRTGAGGRGMVGGENVRPTRGQRLADEYFGGRLKGGQGEGEGGSSPVFL